MAVRNDRFMKRVWLPFVSGLLVLAAYPQHEAVGRAGPVVLTGVVVDAAGQAIADPRLYLWRAPTQDALDSTSNVAMGELGRQARPTSTVGLNRPCSPTDLDAIGTFVIGDEDRRAYGSSDGSFRAEITSDSDWVVYATNGVQSSAVTRVHGDDTVRLVVSPSPPLHGVIVDDIGPMRATLCVRVRGIEGCVARGASDVWGRFFIDDVPLDVIGVAVHSPERDTRSRHTVERTASALVIHSLLSPPRHASGVVEGVVQPAINGVVELVEANPQVDFGDATQVAIDGYDGKERHPFAVVAAAPIDGQGHYRIVDVPPGRYRALYVSPNPAAIGGDLFDGFQLVPDTITVAANATARATMMQLASAHPLEIKVMRERDEPVRGEAVGIFVGDDRPRYLVGLIDYRATAGDPARYFSARTTLLASPKTWLWPSRPQTFYSMQGQFIERYAKPVQIGDAAKVTLHVARAAAADHGCNTEGPGL